jgi:methionyl aminopeptidase
MGIVAGCMKIPIKSAGDIEAMRVSGRAVGQVLFRLQELIEPGITTGEVDAAAGRWIKELGGRSAFLGYRGFPGNICISVNDEIVHGIGGRRRLLYGDLVKMDVGIFIDGWVGDSAVSVPVGVVAEDVQKLIAVSERALWRGIAEARAGNRLGQVSSTIQDIVEDAGYSVVREFVGHGLGRELHEEPQIPNYGRPESGPRLKPGMTLAIEPMVNMGGAEIKMLSDGWTVVAADKKPSAHVEHTVLVTEGDPEILTPRLGLVIPAGFRVANPFQVGC